MSKKLRYLSINQFYTVPELRNYNVIKVLSHKKDGTFIEEVKDFSFVRSKLQCFHW
jgi:hypothetical protein